MGKKKTSTPARLQEPKKVLKKEPFKASVKNERKKYYFKQGEGSVGVCIRRPRLLKFMRETRKNLAPKLMTTTNKNGKKTKEVFYKGYTDVVIGALDAYTNMLLKTAMECAKQRQNKSGKVVGLKLNKTDLELAKKLITKLTYNN